MPSHHRSVAVTLFAVSLAAMGFSTQSHARGDAPDVSAGGPAVAVLLPDLGPPPSVAEVSAGSKKRPSVQPHRNGVAKRLPLGSKDLKETRSVRTIAKGVTLTVIRRGDMSARKRSAKNGPWVVRVLTIDPKVADGYLTATYGPSVAGTTPVTKLTRAVDALAGVNASFFAIGSRTPGNPVGFTVARGKVLSDPSGMKREVTLLVDSERNQLRITKLRWSGRLVDLFGRSVKLTKINAVPRVPDACRTTRSQARCKAPGQVAAFTPRFGERTPNGVGTEVLLDRDGCAVKVQSHRGMRLTKGRSSIQATGAAARGLRSLVKHSCVEIKNTVRDARGNPVRLTPTISAVTGRFQLLDEGRGVAPTRRDDPFFNRHPRTIAGTMWDGKIVLATVDGRSSRSIGVTLPQAAGIAWALGMRDAVNLDGGGSTTMAIRGKLENKVSGGRERAVSDALVWLRERD